ncbi:TRAP transporter substrate-binding protein [Acidaminococcus timonensis]|uniref:TRAP transporter substrate-binding protein n=1 Tax=Acidaminococcus timonensis TaxID=1871002 RepID=UPI0026F1F723|nr:TRAP transporter substrate-binding protein [Acidaminococcus timonensis]
MHSKVKKIMMACVTGLLVLGLSGCGSEKAQQQEPAKGPYADLPQVTLVGGDSSGKGSVGQRFGELVAKKVATKTEGRLKIDYHPNAELGGDEDLLRQLRANDIQLVVGQMAPVTAFVPEGAVFDLPMVFTPYDGKTIDRVLNGDGPFRTKLAAAYERAGLHYLGTLQNGTYRLMTSNKPVRTLEDFKGIKIRTMSNKNHMAFWSVMGANPTPLAWPELYFSLQSGIVEAEENAADSIVSANFNEVQKYVAATNVILYANELVVNKKAFDALPEAYQKVLEESVQEAMAELAPTLVQVDKDSKAKLQQKGMTLITYPPEFYKEVRTQPGVIKLYQQIDQQTNGLGTLLMQELKKNA